MSQQILVTGAQGFLGRFLIGDWLNDDANTSILGIGRSIKSDSYFTHKVGWGSKQCLAPIPLFLQEQMASDRYRYLPIDITEEESLTQTIRDFSPDIIIHLAAALRDDPPSRLVSSNISTVTGIFNAIEKSAIKVPRVVFGSSGSVYGKVPVHKLPIHEDNPRIPIDPYSATKRAAEEIGQILAKRQHVPALWARIFNPVGPGQDERHLCGWLGRQMGEIASNIKQPSISVGPLHPTRDFIDVRDTATALRIIAQNGIPEQTYNVASGIETSGQMIFDTLAQLANVKNIRVERKPARKVDMERHYADIGRLLELGYKPRYSISESLDDVLSYYRNDVANEF